jgi:protein gp37
MSNPPRLSVSNIEYLDHIWSFYSGCRNPISICLVSPNCWARDTVNRFGYHYPNGFEPTFYPEAYLSPLSLKKPARIGVAFMGDLFGNWVDPGMTVGPLDSKGRKFARMPLKDLIFTVIRGCPQHTFIFLTKCGWNLQKWSPFPDNCQVGISALTEADFSLACLYLRDIEAKVKFISLEPLYFWTSGFTRSLLTTAKKSGITWLVIGRQTKPYRSPQVAWVEDIVSVAIKLGIKVFLKNNLRSLLPDNDYDLFYVGSGKARHLRQEVP